ncbi:hydroxysteroid 11-beta-dehydrogenase 1-like protein [Striga asiatica]|uniref:Hydroxysteroid 11-beta-dehydrogenase 1-like protein n=1 Tax=Striga asiatica TaxID=4170 RepID=A0A5A7PYB5_STRAF|nr:hydroxysteroid 11-beta-dehydrogenase 1-like protein [Striga asiatica]
MNLVNAALDFFMPPASLLMLAFAWPTLFLVNAGERIYKSYYDSENMDNKVVLITGASSGIGEQIAYQYAQRGANLVLIARRENRLRGISENARRLGAPNVLIMAADVVKEEECRRFDINFWGNVYPTYVALPYLRESNGRIVVNASVENWLPLPRMSLYSAAKSALMNFYETLRFEVKDEVGITVATHGWIGTEIAGGKFMVEEGAEMQWKEEREVHVSGGAVDEFAKLIVAGACRGDPYVKYPSWYDIFFLYRVFAPKVLYWTFRFLLSNGGGVKRVTSYIGTGRPLIEAAASSSPPRKQLYLEAASPPPSFYGTSSHQRKFE